MSAETHTAFVKQTAAQLGFEYCGIAHATYLDEDARRLEHWLNKGLHGNMGYMHTWKHGLHAKSF